MKPDFWSKLDRYPPLVVRLLACKRVPGKGKVAITDEEIATRSGLALSEIKSLSWLASWDGVPVSRVRQFSEACGVFFNRRSSMRTTSNISRRRTASTTWHEPFAEGTRKPADLDDRAGFSFAPIKQACRMKLMPGIPSDDSGNPPI